MSDCDLLLTGGTVITVDDDRRVVEKGAVAITGDHVTCVDSAAVLSGWRAKRTVDCSGAAIMPGLIDTHTHLYQGLARSLGEGLKLWSWLSDFMWPYASRMTLSDARCAALLGAVEAVRGGTTSILDHHYAPADTEVVLEVAAAVEAVGLRGVIARGMAGTASPIASDHNLAGALFTRSTTEELAITLECIDARPPGGQVTVWPGPHNVVYADRELLQGSVALAREAGVRWHAHCASTPGDTDIYAATYGQSPIAWLHEQGLLGPGTTLAHGVNLDTADVAMLGETATAIAHCPVSNQYGADGVIRLRDLRDAGASVALGTDGPAYNHRQDLFDCMKHSVLLQRIHHLNPRASNSREALDLATREGAKLLGINAGTLSPGMLADVIVVDMGAAHLTPHHDVQAALVYSARGSDVTMTIVGGRVVFEDGKCTLVDQDKICADALQHAGALLQRAGLTTRHDWPSPEEWRGPQASNTQRRR